MFVGLDLDLRGVGIGGVMTVSVAPHHTTTPPHITYLHFLRSPQSQPASAEHFLSHKAILPLPVYTRPPSCQDVAQHCALIAALVTLSHSRDMLQLWPTTSEQTLSKHTTRWVSLFQ